MHATSSKLHGLRSEQKNYTHTYWGPTKSDRTPNGSLMVFRSFAVPPMSRSTCHPQRLGIVVDLYLAVLIAEKVAMFLIE